MKWTHEQLEALPEAAKKRNAHLFGNHPSAKLLPEKPQPDQRSQGQDRGMEAPEERYHISVTFIVRRPRLLDKGDNDRTSLKPGRDFIAGILGFASDDDERLSWHYHQIKSRTKSTSIIIDRITE